jgi:hypothetical protein
MEFRKKPSDRDSLRERERERRERERERERERRPILIFLQFYRKCDEVQQQCILFCPLVI